MYGYGKNTELAEDIEEDLVPFDKDEDDGDDDSDDKGADDDKDADD
jgi:hypothetical protein